MNISVYDKSTFKFLHYGNKNSRKVRDFLDAGHIDGGYEFGGLPHWLMWNPVTMQAVPDMDRRNADEAAEEQGRLNKQRVAAILIELEGLYQDHTAQNTRKQVDLLNELARIR